MRETIVNFADKPTAASNTSGSPAKKPRIESSHLFQGNSEIVIVHHDEEYSLRITKNGKLILTK